MKDEIKHEIKRVPNYFNWRTPYSPYKRGPGIYTSPRDKFDKQYQFIDAQIEHLQREMLPWYLIKDL
ncbi:MAG: hypothetical protein QXR48_02200 [Candidatus Woesearchaeota archaeon]